MRVSKDNFDVILIHVRRVIEKRHTHRRNAIPADQRPCATLFYLANGDAIKCLTLLFRMGESTVRSIIYETRLYKTPWLQSILKLIRVMMTGER